MSALVGHFPYVQHTWLSEEGFGFDGFRLKSYRGDVEKRGYGEEGIWRRGDMEKRGYGEEGIWRRGDVEKRGCGEEGIWRRGDVEKREGKGREGRGLVRWSVAGKNII
jgi:hypothetical protein